MIGDRQEIARLQSDFYRDNYYKMLKLLYVEIFIMLILILVIIYHIIIHPPQPFYASTMDGKILSLAPGK